jgi:hypothetical protein
MGGVIALLVSVLAFAVPLAIVLFTMRWRSYAVVLALGAAFFWWLDNDIRTAPGGGAIGAFLGGMMLVGFGAGAVAKFVMLLGRVRTPGSGAEAAPDRHVPPSV